MPSVSYYPTYEGREDVFREAVHSLLPRKHSGPSIFWKDMSKILSISLSDPPLNPIACISTNPRDCLAYSFVDDLLIATTLSHPQNKRSKLLEKTIDYYELSNLRNQEIHTLSGGEVMKLALARNFLLSHTSMQSIMSSPFSWLSVRHFSLYENTIKSFLERNKRVHVLYMEGENDNMAPTFEIASTLESRIEIEDVKIKLTNPLSNDQNKETWSVIENASIKFASPCLLTGDNGSGKSLIAKAISGAIESSGTAIVKTHGYIGHSRLIFQDIVTQSMLRPFSHLVSSSISALPHDINKIYDELFAEFTNYFKEKNQEVPFIGNIGSSSKTLIEYKMMLVALRLCVKGTGIFLDEPDWGLTKESAIAYFVSVVKVAHKRDIAVVLISHKMWWNNIVKSCIEVEKKIYEHDNIKYIFKIKSKKLEGGEA